MLVPLAILSALIWPGGTIPMGIIAGGLIALVNVKGMRAGLKSLLGTNPSAIRIFLLSSFRLMVLFAVMTALALSRAVDMLGFTAGFTVVLVLIVHEGYRIARKEEGVSG